MLNAGEVVARDPEPAADGGAPADGRPWGVDALEAQREEIRRYYDEHALRRDEWIARNEYYYGLMGDLFRFIMEPNRSVLQIRCHTGQLLDAVRPSRGVGTDVSEGMVRIAARRYPQYDFRVQTPEDLAVEGTFDYVMFNGVGDTVDVLQAFRRMRQVTTPESRVVIYTYNHLWEPLVKLAERLGWKTPQPIQNWLPIRDIEGLLQLAGYELLRVYRAALLPKRIPLVSWIANQIVAKLPGLQRLCMVNVLVAREAERPSSPTEHSVSVVIPCKNERGNVASAVARIPEMGRHTEIIFADDRSTDGTPDEVRRMQRAYPGRDIRLVDGPGVCKAQNVWTGFDAARGDVLMILDGDLSTMPEELPYFFSALVEGKGEFINGSRMVYPMQDEAMRVPNMVGNKVFGMLFSYVLGQPVRDTLCGTKVFWRRDWPRIKALRGTWGVEDAWGDYELLFGAAKLQLKVVDIPVHYQERVYGETKMRKRLRNGLRMLRMCWAALLKLKLIQASRSDRVA